MRSIATLRAGNRAGGGLLPAGGRHFSDPPKILEAYIPEDEQLATGLARNWYNAFPGCTQADRDAAAIANPGVLLGCDEFPNYSMVKAGPVFNAEIKLISAADNQAERVKVQAFYNNPVCGRRIKAAIPANRQAFIVVPSAAVATVTSCGTARN